VRFKRRLYIKKGDIDIVPLINIIFLLLIFFIISSSFIFQSGMTVDIPKAITSEVLHKEGLMLTVTKDSKLFLGDRQMTYEELISRFRIAATQNRPVIIKADRKASFGEVVRVWDLCRKEGISKVNIATSQEAK